MKREVQELVRRTDEVEKAAGTDVRVPSKPA
jgi:hypothetical protein